MKTNNLLLVGGGFIAGYVVCKLMNRNSESMSFSLSGEDNTISGGRGYQGQKFKFNGRGDALTGSEQNQYFRPQFSQQFQNQTFELTGKSVRVILSANPSMAARGYYEISDLPNAKKYLQTTRTINPSGREGGQRRLWLPADSLAKI